MGKPAGRSELRRVTVRRRLLVERLGDRRVLAAITGAVFEDLNFSFQREVGEADAPRRLIFIDANQNEQLDSGEPITVAESDGTFKFDGLTDGSYLVRLFNGTTSQIQTTPVEASPVGDVLSIENATQFQSVGAEYVAINSESIVIGELASGSGQPLLLGDQVAKMQTLPGGKLLVVGSDSTGPNSWLVDPQTRSVLQVDLDGDGGLTPWIDVAVDAGGRGLLLQQSDEPFPLRAVDASVIGGSLQITTTSTLVPADTQVLASDSGNRSVLAWAGDDGLQLSLWSNVTASLISSSATDLTGATELLAFDDASGLLAVRTIEGGVRVHDVDGNFAAIHTLDGVTGPVAIDGSRDLLVAISSEEAMLKLISLRDGGSIADFAIDLSALGPVTSLSFNDPQTIGILGAAGIAEIALRRPAAREVTITGGQAPDPILFGVAFHGANTAPNYRDLPFFSTEEDVAIVAGAPGAMQGSGDADGDHFVLVQQTAAAHGIALIQIDGGVSYTPDPDFNGGDSVVVLLHDGRDTSFEFELGFNVEPVPDAPSDIRISIDPVPEDVQPGKVIGNIEIIDVDGVDDLNIDVLDPRFGVNGNEIIFLGGVIDFESEPMIAVPIVVTDPQAGDRIETIFGLTVTEKNHPIEGIWPDEASVLEAAVGEQGNLVTFIYVIDPDSGQEYTLTVDDDRFQIIDQSLFVRPGIALDHETEPIVVVNVTAKENFPNGSSLTEPIKIEVWDVPEQPQSIQLSNDTVMEKVPGEIVGEVTIDGNPPDSRFQLSVDDPRFEIVDGTLKLLDGQIVDYASQSEIEIGITAQDKQRVFSTITQPFLIHVMENDTPQHNHGNPYDVDHSGKVTALDALAIINYLNTYGPGPVGATDIGYCYDVNADTMVTALDALLVLNELNRTDAGGDSVGSGEGGGEGEAVPTNQPTIAPIPRPATDLSTPAPQRREDDVFDQLGREPKPLPIASATTPNSTEERSLEMPQSTSDEAFAENVDQTIRLLSDN